MKVAFVLVALLFTFALCAQTNEVERIKVDEVVPATIDVSEVVPVELAQMCEVEADSVPPVTPASERTAWYDSIDAEKGSKAYWILYMARERAKRGENTDDLAKSFVETLYKWMSQ